MVISARLACLLLLTALGAQGCASTAARPEAAAGSTTPSETAPAAAAAATGAEPDKDVMAALMAGEFAWQDGRSDSAARHYARAAELGQDPGIAEHATKVALSAQQWGVAADTIARWRALDPKAAGLVQADAALALGKGETGPAAELLASLLDQGKAGRRQAAQALVAAPDRKGAAQVVADLLARPVLGGGTATLLLLGQVSEQLGDRALALRAAELAVAREPDDARAWFGRSHARLRADDKAGARSDARQALALDPDSREIRLTYAALLDDGGDTAAAARVLAEGKPDDELLGARAAYAARTGDKALMREAYQALVALPLPAPDARIELLGQMAELIGAKGEAIDWYGKVPRGDQYIDSQLRIAVLLDDKGDTAGARDRIRALRAEGIEDDAQLVDTYLLEAELASKRGRQEDAVDVLRRGLEVLPDDQRLLYARALVYERMDRVEEALRDLQRMVALNPDDPDALNALGYTLADRTQRLEEAQVLIEKALALKPDEPAIIDSLGWVLFRRGEAAKAEIQLRKAFEMQPDAEIAAHLGEVLWSLGRRDEARRIWDEGKARDADNPTLRATVMRLDR